MNKVILIGRLTKDPEMRTTTSGKSVTRFTLAVDRPGTNGEKTADFIPCVAFGKTAETIARYLSKGRQTAVEGNIKTGSYEGKDGRRVYTTDVWVDRFEFIGNKNDNQGEVHQDSVNDAFMAVDEDIPF